MKIRKSQKRWVAKILVLVMLITCLPMTQKQEARAAGGVYNKLVSLKTSFRMESFGTIKLQRTKTMEMSC